MDKPNSKMMKMMGIQISQVLGTCFKTGGKVAKQENQMFWQQVLQPKEATEFLLTVLDQLKQNIEKKMTGVSTATLINTAVFILLNIQIKTDNQSLKDFLKYYKKNRDMLVKGFPPIREAMRTLQLIVEHSWSELIGPLVISCSTLHSLEVFQQLAQGLQFPAFSDEDIVAGENSFIYNYLCTQANTEPQARLQILTHNLNKTLTLPQQMKMNPKVAQTTLLALLHMLNRFLAIGPFDPNFLKRALSTIQQFYLWPKPYGTAAKKVLEALQMELLAPGYTLRERLTRQALSVDRGTAFFYIHDEESKNSISTMVTMEAVPLQMDKKRKSTRKEPRIPLSPVHQALLLMSSFYFENGVGYTPADHEGFQKLTAEQACSLYEIFQTEFLDDIPKNFQSAKEKRVQVLLKVKSELAKVVSNPSAITLQYPQCNPIYTPPDTEVEHISIGTQLSYSFDDLGKVKMMGVKYMPYPMTPIFEQYTQLLNHYSSNKRDVKAPLPILLMGGDRLIHCFLCAHMRVLQTDPGLFQGLDVKFFILPTEENSISSFIARTDAWYNRHIYIPFRQNPFILPVVRIESGSKLQESKDSKLTVPGQYFRDLVTNYVHESRFKWDFNVYQVECWVSERKEQKEEGVTDEEKELENLCDYNIPFFQGVEIGQTAACVDFLEKKKDVERKEGDPPMKVDDVLKDRDFVFLPPNVSINFTKIDLSLKTSTVGVEENIAYESIVLLNIPKKNDKRPLTPDPIAPWLEMHAKAKNPGSKRNILVMEPRQHVIALTIAVTDIGASFEILVDGQLFKGLKKIKISRVHHIEGQKNTKIWNSQEHSNKQKGSIVQFPVETFFPHDF